MYNSYSEFRAMIRNCYEQREDDCAHVEDVEDNELVKPSKTFSTFPPKPCKSVRLSDIPAPGVKLTESGNVDVVAFIRGMQEINNEN